jgi:hypothetical protein
MACPRQECMDADYDCQNNEGGKANGYEQNGEDFYPGSCHYQHGVGRVSLAGTPRYITGGGYGSAGRLF